MNASPFNLPEPTFGAYELKFVLPDEIVAPVIGWAQSHIPADPHAGPGGVYEVNSLYFDSEAFGVFHRHAGFGERKYRIRRYGEERTLVLEEKEKTRGWVRKRRTFVAEDALDRLHDEGAWEGAWFSRVLREGALVPQSQVAYRRVARMGEANGEPIRLTVDRDVRCASAQGLRLPALPLGQPIVRNILELKFGRNGLPSLYKGLIREFGLEPDASSKYRLSVEAIGLAREVDLPERIAA